MGNHEHFYIGELARKAKLGPKTVRYYEELGLLPEAPRSESGYRVYTEADLHRLRFILKAKRFGLSLAEIREILSLSRFGETPCCRVVGLLSDHIAEVERSIRELEELRDEMARLRDYAAVRRLPSSDSQSFCPIIESCPEAVAAPASAASGGRTTDERGRVKNRKMRTGSSCA
ncbi:MAG: heavy metal-responsive transcriptional regulator [Chloroflexota bacterium]|nr:MAG: heavy metal-responsive transcriptional regulator [Chloroflexota bacterium]